MQLPLQYLYLLIVVIGVIIIWYFANKDTISLNGETKEDFEVYKQKPFDYIETGSTPMGFYRKDAYRLPYRFPYQFAQSYPFPHMTFWKNL